MEKSDTMCYLLYCVDLGYFWSLKSDLVRYTVLAIALSFFWVISKYDQWEILSLWASLITVSVLVRFCR